METRITEIAIQRMLAMAMPSNFSERAKKYPASPKKIVVMAKRYGFL